MANKATDASKGKNSTVQKYSRMFQASWDYASQTYHERWARNWRLYNNIREDDENYPGTIRTFVPMVNSAVNTIVASLFNTVPSVDYAPNSKDQQADTKVLNDVYQDFARRDGWAAKNKINGRQGIITGNYCAYYEWQPSKDGGYVHKVIVPVRDMVIDPQSTSYENWRYVGRRFFKTIDELKREKIYDFEKQKMVSRYHNLEGLKGTGGEEDAESDRAIKDQSLGSTAPTDASLIELVEIWTHKKVAVLANREVLIEERDNPYYVLEKSRFKQRKLEHELERIETLEATGQDIGEFKEEFDEDNAGLLPFAHGCEYQDISLVYGSSDVDIIADSQELLNTLTDLNIEAELYTVFPERSIDNKYTELIDDLNPAPGKVYPVPAGAMQWNNPPMLPQAVFNERLNIKGEIREASAVSEISKGITATDSTTATEIKAMLGQADARIREKAQNLADGFFFQEAKIVLKFLQLYADDSFFVRSVSDAGVNFEEVNMKDFLGEYTPMVTLDIQRKLEEGEKRDAYVGAYQMIIADPTNNLEAAKKIMYHKMMPELTQEEIEQIITPPTPQQAPAPMLGEAPVAEEEMMVSPNEMIEEGEVY